MNCPKCKKKEELISDKSDQLLKKTSHISDAEILQDIYDTQMEIIALENECRGFALLLEAKPPDSRMIALMMSHRENGIKKRKDFILNLQVLKTKRKE